MSLSKQQQQKVLQHMQKHMPNANCSFCGNGKLDVIPELSGAPRVEENNGNINIFPDQVAPMVQIVCPKCKRVQHFLAKDILNI